MRKVRYGMIVLLLVMSFLHLCSARAEAPRKLTLMVYMCGSNLESSYGSASADIHEMLDSGCDFSQVNVLIMAGGSSRWDLGIDPEMLCVYQLTERGIRPVWSDVAC